MKHPNEHFIDINLRSKLLNNSGIARMIGMTPQNYHNKLNGLGTHKPFTTAELIDLEQKIRDDLFGTNGDRLPDFGNENIPLENFEL